MLLKYGIASSGEENCSNAERNMITVPRIWNQRMKETKGSADHNILNRVQKRKIVRNFSCLMNSIIPSLLGKRARRENMYRNGKTNCLTGFEVTISCTSVILSENGREVPKNTKRDRRKGYLRQFWLRGKSEHLGFFYWQLGLWISLNLFVHFVMESNARQKPTDVWAKFHDPSCLMDRAWEKK